MVTRAMEGESTAFDRLVPGANGVRRWMTIRVVPDAAPSGEVHGAFVLMNDIHGLKQAQEMLRSSEAELRLIMDNVPARVVVHRPRLSLPLAQPTQRGMAGREPQGTDGPQVRRGRRQRSREPAGAAARPRADRRDGVHREAAGAAGRPGALGVGSLRAAPRRRGQRHRHLRRAHGHPRPEAQRRRAEARQLDAVVAHQQHAAGGARVGPRFPPRALVAAGGEHLRLAVGRDPRHPARRQPARPRGRPRRASPAWSRG